ncbi:hypothetical protein RRG08_027239 [Elysia crispata]|uniref:non-specific serine/threonine protein kinase n=1 Tax=Elysia crispata TaxID=231223 RepID=A0AAE1DLZ3_9GAST|nr:hypothetical protein RRG08_027239 [Elysia crispata]
MEIANSKQQADPVDKKATDDLEDTEMPSSPCEVEEEIDVLYQNVPEISSHFTILEKIGEGAFSSVFLARLKHYPEVSEMFALKHILPTTHPARIENELRCLLKLGGQDNVMGVKLCLRNKDNVVIVMDYFPHEKFQEVLSLMSTDEARDYMRNLLIALKRIHQYKVIHRDVKPSNFLYNRQKKQYALVDFGLASGNFLIDRDGEKIGRKNASPKSCTAPSSSNAACVPLSPSKANINQSNRVNPSLNKGSVSIPLPSLPKRQPSFAVPSCSAKAFLERSGLCDCLGKPQICSLCVARKNQLAPRAGTAGFRAPEVLLKSPVQDTAVDIWSAGTIFLSVLSARYPFFRAQDDLGYLAQIISVVGSAACVDAAKSFGKALTLSESLPALDLRTTCLKLRSTQMSARLGPSDTGHQLSDLVHSWSNISQEAFHLLGRMLDPNPGTRITAEEALKHPYFTECGLS